MMFLHFRVHTDPIFIKNSRFHTLPQEKLVTKVILMSLPWTLRRIRMLHDGVIRRAANERQIGHVACKIYNFGKRNGFWGKKA